MSRQSFDVGERRRIAAAVAAGAPPICPACSGALTVTAFAPPPDVPYVRRRLLVVCSGCRRTASIDAPAE